jgi:HEAT repeat protein
MTEINSKSSDARLVAACDALRSQDVITQNEGVASAIQIGPAAVPFLLALFDEPGINRGQAMYALAQIGDPRAEEVFLKALGDSNERVRAFGAQGLVRLGHPSAMAASLQTLNDAPDELHLDRTPSVAALGDMGLKPVGRLLDLLMNRDERTRLRSQRALERILARRHGLRRRQGVPSEADEEAMRAEWRANGDYDFRATEEARSASVARWRRWLAAATEAAPVSGNDNPS